jgi:hypothetical protein
MPIHYFGGLQAPVSGTSERGRDPITVNQLPGGGQRYPFVRPSSDIELLLGDLFLSYIDDSCQYEPPFHVGWMYGFGSQLVSAPAGWPSPTHAFDIVIVDDQGRHVFDSTQAQDFVRVSWGDGNRLETIEWKGANGTLRVTRYTTWPSYMTPIQYDVYIEPTNGELVGRTYVRDPEQVRSITVGSQTIPAGDLALEAGFNMRLDHQSPERVDGGRFTHRLVLNATPGEGLGRASGCDEQPPVRRIGGTAGRNGDFLLDPMGCYRTQRPVELTQAAPRKAAIGNSDFTQDLNDFLQRADDDHLDPDKSDILDAQDIRDRLTDDPDETARSSLWWFNDCSPCCDCDDYVRTYRGLKNQWNRLLNLGDRGETARDNYASARDRWANERQCRLDHAAKLLMSKESTVTAGVTASHCNMLVCCFQPLILRVTVQVFKDDGTVDSSVGANDLSWDKDELLREGSDTSGKESADWTSASGFPVYDMVYDWSFSQSLSLLIGRLRVNNATSNQTLRLTLSVHTPDTDLCTQRTDSVPSDIQTLWNNNNPAPYPTRLLVQKQIPLG